MNIKQIFALIKKHEKNNSCLQSVAIQFEREIFELKKAGQSLQDYANLATEILDGSDGYAVSCNSKAIETAQKFDNANNEWNVSCQREFQ